MELWRIMAYISADEVDLHPQVLSLNCYKSRVKRQAEIHSWDDPAAHDVRFSAGHFSWQRPQVWYIWLQNVTPWKLFGYDFLFLSISLGRLTSFFEKSEEWRDYIPNSLFIVTEALTPTLGQDVDDPIALSGYQHTTLW